VKHITEMIAAAGGAQARVQITRGYDVVVNTRRSPSGRSRPSQRVGGEQNVGVMDKVCGAEDFSFYQKVVPGFFFRLGCIPADMDLRTRSPTTARASTWTRAASSSALRRSAPSPSTG
jgi:amidohydrolase